MSTFSKPLPVPPHKMIPCIDGSEDMEELEFTLREAEVIALSKPRRPSEPSTLPNAKAFQVLGINTRSTFDQDSDSDEGEQTDHSSSSNHHGTVRSKSPSFMSSFSKRLHKKSPSIGGSSTSSFRRGGSIDDHVGYRSSIDEFSGSSVRSSEDSSLGGFFRRTSKDHPKTAEQVPPRSSSMQNQMQNSNPVRKSSLIDTRAAISAGWMRGPAAEWPYKPRKKGSRAKKIPSIIPPSHNPSKSLIPASSPALTAEFTDLYRDETDCEDEAEWAITVEDRSNSIDHQIIDDRLPGAFSNYNRLPEDVRKRQFASKSRQKQHQRTFSTDNESNASFSTKSSRYSTKADFERFSSSGSSTSHTSGVPSLMGSSEKHDSLDSSSIWSCTTGRSSKMETIATPFDLRKFHQNSPPLCPPPKEALPPIPTGEKAWHPKMATPPLLHSISSTQRASPKSSRERSNGRPLLLKADKDQDINTIRNENAHTPRIRPKARGAKIGEEFYSEELMSTLPKLITTDNPRHAIIECEQDQNESEGHHKQPTFGIPRPAPSPPDGSGAVVRTHQPAVRNLPAIVTTRASTPAVSLQVNPLEAEQKEEVAYPKKEQDRMETLFLGTQDSPDERLPEERKAAFETAVRRLDGTIPDQDVTEEGINNYFDGQEKQSKEHASDESSQDQDEDDLAKHANDVPSPDTVARMVEQLLKEVPCSPLGKTISQIIEDEKITSPTEPDFPARSDSPTYAASISSTMTDSSLVPSYYLRSPSLPSSGEESGFVLTFEAEETPIEEKLEENVIEEKPEQEAIAEQEEEQRQEEENRRGEAQEQKGENGEEDDDNKAFHEQIHDFLQPDETPSFEFDEYMNKKKPCSMISLKSPLIPDFDRSSSPELSSKGGEDDDSKDSLAQRHGFSTPLHLIKDKITFDGDYDAPSLSSSPSSSEISSNMEQIAEEDRAIRTMEDALDQILSDLPPMCLKTIEPLSPLRLLDGTIPSALNTPKVDAFTPNTALQHTFPKSPAPKALNVYKTNTRYSTSLSRPRPNKLLDPTTPRSLFPRGPITPRSPKPRKEAPLPMAVSQATIDDAPMQLDMDFDASPMSMAAFIPSDSPFKKQDLIPSSPFPTPLPDWPETPVVRENDEEQAGVQSPIPFLPQLSSGPKRAELPRSPLPSEVPLPRSPKPSTKMTLDSLKPRVQPPNSTLQIPSTARELYNHSTPLSPFAKDVAISAPCTPRSPLSLRALRSAKPIEQHPSSKTAQRTDTRKVYLAASPSMSIQSNQNPAMFVPSSMHQVRNIPAPLVSTPKTDKVSNPTSPTHSPSSKSPPPRTPKSPKRYSNNQCSTPLTAAKANVMQTKRYVLPI
ncbi:uncharacterized protein FA14DRAFT_51539 [Meira miltonrushii]|uniref:Uncharacterized protein n=1 Tax=Meira miltonrushii TaxID=1280837 RepID=A0A316VIC4_9BASI|nr:uncharacterized protein FA14DRAFT_51539 [Meira miltonrushii]PWN36073.1 hypothetical protein FA14DRAFT_51539 [Meira miltonrushii]